MQIKCNHCSMPFSMNQETAMAAIEELKDQSKHHYDAHCPKCRRAVYVTRDQLGRAYPAYKKKLAGKE
jgi:hypothetical protein